VTCNAFVSLLLLLTFDRVQWNECHRDIKQCFILTTISVGREYERKHVFCGTKTFKVITNMKNFRTSLIWRKFSLCLHRLVRRSSAVGIATGYGLHDQGVWVRVRVGSRIFIPPHRPNWPIQPPIKWIHSSAVKREAAYSPPTNAEMKKTWIYISTPLYVFML
jgi:hypothetical protein